MPFLRQALEGAPKLWRWLLSHPAPVRPRLSPGAQDKHTWLTSAQLLLRDSWSEACMAHWQWLWQCKSRSKAVPCWPFHCAPPLMSHSLREWAQYSRYLKAAFIATASNIREGDQGEHGSKVWIKSFLKTRILLKKELFPISTTDAQLPLCFVGHIHRGCEGKVEEGSMPQICHFMLR